MKMKKMIAILASLSMLATSVTALAADPAPAEAQVDGTVDVVEAETDITAEELELRIAGDSATEVGDFASLKEAIKNANEGDTIKLTADISKESEAREIDPGVALTIDLNNFTLGLNGDNLFSHDITFKNGKIELGPKTSTGYIWMYGDVHLNLDSVEISGNAAKGYAVIDFNDHTTGSATIKDSTITLKDEGDTLKDKSEATIVYGCSNLVIINSTISATNVARGFVNCVVNSDKDTEITIKDNTKTAFRNVSGVIDSTVTIANCENGIENDNGTVLIFDDNSVVDISGGSSVDPDGKDINLTNNSIVIRKGNAQITTSDGTTASDPVASIGDEIYISLQEAVNAAQNGDTITLLDNISQDDGVKFDKANTSVKLDLNEHTFTVNTGSNVNSRAIRIDNGTLEVYNGSIIAVGSGTTSSDGAGCYGAFRVEANGVLNAHDLTLTNSRPWGLNVKVLGGEATLTNVDITSSYGGGIEVTNADLDDSTSKQGNATLTNCTFTQTGYYDHCSTTLSVSGGSVLNINGGSYTSENYALYVFSSGGVINVNGGTFSGGKDAVIAYLDLNTYPDYEGGLNISDGMFTGTFNIASPAYLNITGGTYTTDPSAYVASGHYAKDNGDGTWTVLKADTIVKDNANRLTTSVTLNDLEKTLQQQSDDTNYVATEDAKYRVVMDAPTGNDKAKVDALTGTFQQGSTTEAYDIKVIKTLAGVESEVHVTNQKATIEVGGTIGDADNDGDVDEDDVKVKHIKADGTDEDITVTAVSGNTIEFIAPSFSTYVINYSQGTVAPADKASKINVTFENENITGTTAEYDLVLNGVDADNAEKVINRFMSSKWNFTLAGDAVSYEIIPVTNINLLENGEYAAFPNELNMSGEPYSDATGKKITLAKVKIYGVGHYAFYINDAEVHTSKVVDNIVEDFKVSDSTLVLDGTDGGNAYNNKTAEGTQAKGELTSVKHKLDINVIFPNNAEAKAAAYNDMKVTISGGDLPQAYEIALGNDVAAVSDSDTFVAADGTKGSYSVAYVTNNTFSVPNEYNEYKLSVENILTKNVAYTIAVSGEGYRTARYTVNMTDDKELNFWNNVMDTDKAIEAGKATMKTNFLAGDIVKDNKINIYDLSAVVSYFGTTELVDNHPDYAKYDLNRDNKIDSKDIAYVLVSWDK